MDGLCVSVCEREREREKGGERECVCWKVLQGETGLEKLNSSYCTACYQSCTDTLTATP